MKFSGILDRPIAFQRSFVTLTGSIKAALMLSQAVYWQYRNQKDGWWFQSQEKWEDETGMTRSEQESARKRLRTFGFWKEAHEGIPCKLWFRVDLEMLEKALLDMQTSMRESCKLDRGESALWGAAFQHPPIKETSNETSLSGAQETPSVSDTTEHADGDDVSPLFADMASDALDPQNQPPIQLPKVPNTPPSPPRKKGDRCPLKDTLATLNGEDLNEVTKTSWSAICKALSIIKQVAPDVTADEIKRRRLRYIQLHPKWELTPLALAKHWASLSQSVTKPAPINTGIPNISTYKPPTHG